MNISLETPAIIDPLCNALDPDTFEQLGRCSQYLNRQMQLHRYPSHVGASIGTRIQKYMSNKSCFLNSNFNHIVLQNQENIWVVMAHLHHHLSDYMLGHWVTGKDNAMVALSNSSDKDIILWVDIIDNNCSLSVHSISGLISAIFTRSFYQTFFHHFLTRAPSVWKKSEDSVDQLHQKVFCKVLEKLLDHRFASTKKLPVTNFRQGSVLCAYYILPTGIVFLSKSNKRIQLLFQPWKHNSLISFESDLIEE